MENFKFFVRKKTNDELLQIVYDNIFTITFVSNQLKDLQAHRTFYKVIDHTSQHRTFKMMLCNKFFENPSKTNFMMVFIIYNGVEYIDLSLTVGVHNDDVKILNCQECERDIVRNFESRKNSPF
jgi:hypothetical protein